MNLISYLIIALTFFSCRAGQKGQGINTCGTNVFYQPVKPASFDYLDDIKKENGKFIEIEGFFYASFEDVALYPSRHSNSTANALWLNLVIPDSLINKLVGKKVRVIGRVNLTRKGHLNGYLATLDSTFCIREETR